MARMTKADLVELLAANKLSMMRSGYVPESFFDNAVCAPVNPDPGFTLEDAVAYVKNSYKTRDELWMAAKRFGLVVDTFPWVTAKAAEVVSARGV